MSVRNPERILGLRVDAVRLDGTDISGSVTGIQTFEGLHNGFIEADILVLDEANLLGVIEPISLQTIEIEFSEIAGRNDPPVNEYKLTMVVNTINRYNRAAESNQDSFVIHCLSPSLIFNEKLAISRSYKNKTIDSIVNDMLDVVEYDGDRDITATSYRRNLVIPNLRPMEVVTWLGRYATSNGGDGEYVFYEDRDGAHFKPIAEIIDQDAIRKYTFVSTAVKEKQSIYDLPTTAFQLARVFDIFHDVEDSADDVSMCIYDIETGTQKIVTVDERGGEVDSNEIRNFDLNYSNDKYITVHGTGFYEPVSQQTPPTIGKSVVGSARVKRMKASIEIPGENDIVPGTKIELEHRTLNDNELHPVISGVWMIESMRRIVSSSGYSIQADISSDRIMNADGGFFS